MAQLIETGIVIKVDYINHCDMAQVRIPMIHGVPSTYSGIIGVSDGNSAYRQKINDNCSYTKDESNSLFVIDSELPWLPICYPFGSKMGPMPGDLVYVMFENTQSSNGLIMGWTGSQIAYNDVVAGMKDKLISSNTLENRTAVALGELTDTLFS